MGTETWLHLDVFDAEIFPETYKLDRADRADGYGGALIACRTNLVTEKIRVDSPAEAVLTKISTDDPNTHLIVGSIYRTNSTTTIEQIQEIGKVIDKACEGENNIVWLGGDLNLPDIDWRSGKIVGHRYAREINASFMNKCSDVGLVQMNEEPTHDEALLDIFLTNRPGLVTRTKTIPPLSDHDIILTDSTLKAVRIKTPPRTVYMWDKANLEELRADVKGFSDKLAQNDTPDTSTEETWTQICRALRSSMEKHVPGRKCSTKLRQPWENPTTRRLAQHKNRAWRKKKKNPSEANKKNFNKTKKELRRANRHAYQNFIHDLLSDESNPRNLWRLVKSKRRDAIGIAPLKSHGLLHSDPTTKADLLNDQFCGVFTQEDTSSIPDMGQSPHPAMPDIQISVDGVEKLLRNLNPRKAAGPDGISSRLLQTVAKEIAPALTLLFEKSLQTGEIPADWKHAHVHPIFKKGDRSSPANYRPISLTSICCKMLEHVVRNAITSHLERHKIIDDAQHGFRKGRSCETQLILTVHDIAEGLNKKGQTDIILLDFAKAFDKVPHQRLLRKLDYYGIRGRTLQWIAAFLKDRTQRVVVEDNHSSLGHVTSGVPQGSVLGPTLFLIFINDLSENISAQVRLFADDTILYSDIKSNSDCIQLQKDLEQLERWETKWQMEFNVAKCQVLTSTNKSEENTIKANYTLHGQPLDRVKVAKYLGVELNKSLNWSSHVEKTAAKANKTSAFVYRTIRGCPTKVHSTCYKGLVRPIMEYAATVWDTPTSETPGQHDSLEMVQRRSARRIFRDFRPTTSASQLVSKLNLPRLSERRMVARCVMMYKVMHGLVDLKPKEDVIIPNLRPSRGQPAKIKELSTSIVCYHNSFFPATIRTWNSLPAHVCAVDTCSAFKRNVEGWVSSTH